MSRSRVYRRTYDSEDAPPASFSHAHENPRCNITAGVQEFGCFASGNPTASRVVQIKPGASSNPPAPSQYRLVASQPAWQVLLTQVPKV